MKLKYSIITYRLKKSAKPKDVLELLENIMAKHSLTYEECLFKAELLINEYELQGKSYSNKEKNAIFDMCQETPELKEFLLLPKSVFSQKLSIANFSEEDYSKKGVIDLSTIKSITEKIPKPYNVNQLELIFNGTGTNAHKIKASSEDFGFPMGDYVHYERSAYGNEKHSYVYFSSREEMAEKMKNVFLDFALQIPGKYDGTIIREE